MPGSKWDPRGDTRAKPKQGRSKYGGDAATGTVAHSLLIGDDAGEQVRSTINAVLAAGDAIMFSRTTNGSVICFTLYSGENKEKLYAKTTEEVDILLASIENAAADSTT